MRLKSIPLLATVVAGTASTTAAATAEVSYTITAEVSVTAATKSSGRSGIVPAAITGTSIPMSHDELLVWMFGVWRRIEVSVATSEC